MSQTSPARPAGRRPALVTFAAILLLMLGGFELVLAITEFFQYAFGTLPPLVNYSIFWGLLDVLYGLVLLYAGFALLQGQAVGRLVALDRRGLRRDPLVLLPVVYPLGLGDHHRHQLAHHLWAGEQRGLLHQRLSAAGQASASQAPAPNRGARVALSFRYASLQWRRRVAMNRERPGAPLENHVEGLPGRYAGETGLTGRGVLCG